MRLAGALVVAASLSAGTTATEARPPARIDVEAMLTAAADFCEAAAARPAGSGIPMQVRQGVTVHDGSPPAAGVPEIVKRFAATQPSGGIASSPPFYIHFAGADGQVWAVAYDKQPTCDAMVTGSDADMPSLAGRLAATLGKGGWTVVKAVPATADMPLAQHELVKGGPAGAGVRLLVRALAPAAAGRDRVQMQLGFIAGQIEVPRAPKP